MSTIDQGAVTATGDVTDSLMATSVWTDQLLADLGIPLIDVPFVTVGGGMGSFAMADTLRIAGIDTGDISVLGNLKNPSQTYEYLAGNSQIPEHARLRSDSGSTMDCIWGWPGYALREAIAEKSLYRLWQPLSEPVLSEYFTPKAGQVYRSLRREADRIGWSEMLDVGVVRTVRKRQGGGYFVLHTPKENALGTRRVAYRAKFVHLAVGYPGMRFLGDLQEYRHTHQDFAHVVNAYEPHDHVYEELTRHPCTVLVRGSGIVASRIIQRIIDDRDKHGAQTHITHLFRSYPDGPQGDRATFRRPARNGWAYQAFNFPKASWGGQLRDKLERLEGHDRAAFLDATGGTNTAPRSQWRKQLQRGADEGFYVQAHGTVESVVPAPDRSSLVTQVRLSDGSTVGFAADFIIDATGLEASIEEHRVLADLLRHAGAAKNVKGRLDVERDFMVRGTESGEGRLYASGTITLGGYYAGVDSFLGLQYAALRIHDSLAEHGFGKKIGPIRSAVQWSKWARNKKI